MTYKNLSTAFRCLTLSGVVAIVASATAQLRPPPDYDMPATTKPIYMPKTLAGLTSGPITMSRIASYGVSPISYPYGLSINRDQAFAKLQKEGFKKVTLPPLGPGQPPIEFMERYKNGLYQKVTVNGRRRGGGGSTAVLTEAVHKGGTIPKNWPKVAKIDFSKLTIGSQIPGKVLKGVLPDRVVLIDGTFTKPNRWESLYALSTEYGTVWGDFDAATNNKSWTKKGRRTYGVLKNTMFQTVSWIDVQMGPPMRSEGLTAKTFVVVHYVKS